MKISAVLAGLLVLLCGAPAAAENWVTVVDYDEFWGDVDIDSIEARSDGLVYFRERTSDVSDSAVNCRTGMTYTLKLYVHGGLDYPNWRTEGRAAIPGSIGGEIFEYVCNAVGQ
jgi:hypothetical protein